jgi:mycofactocin glycosyltransferase
VTPESVAAIVPAFNDQDGLQQTLLSLDRLGLVKIVVVDDGSDIPLQAPQSLSTPIIMIRHERNRGAAAARNTGLSAVQTDWVYFTDCGCTHSNHLLLSYARERAKCGPHTSAIVGPIEALRQGRLSNYYTHQGILNAPMLTLECGAFEVEAIVTANALVSRLAIEIVGGFDEVFPSAGGEDTDLGIRLRTAGYIRWCDSAVIFHDFQECLADFDARMRRYGRGMRIVSDKLGFDLRPRPFQPFDQVFADLAERQYRMMLSGFDEVG